MKIIFAFLLGLFLLNINLVQAFDLDETVDDEIRKNYNSSKLKDDLGIIDEDLPVLPAILQQSQNVVKSDEIPTKITSIPVNNIKTGNIKIHKGRVFDVTNNTKINDWLAKGNSIKFKTTKPLKGLKYNIPVGTMFYGEIIEVHQPQISCNGGLVVIRVHTMQYKGQTIPAEAYVTLANSKHIFLNNIKGDRTYWKTVWKKGNWGRTMFDKMLTLTIKFGKDTPTLILSPFPFVYGTLCFGLNSLTSPITAFFSKGGHVNIPVGAKFKLRLLQDVYID